MFNAGARLPEYAPWGKARGGRSKQASKCILLATSQWALGMPCGFFVPRQICATALLEKKHVNWKVAAVAGFPSTGQGKAPSPRLPPRMLLFLELQSSFNIENVSDFIVFWSLMWSEKHMKWKVWIGRRAGGRIGLGACRSLTQRRRLLWARL